MLSGEHRSLARLLLPHATIVTSRAFNSVACQIEKNIREKLIYIYFKVSQCNQRKSGCYCNCVAPRDRGKVGERGMQGTESRTALVQMLCLSRDLLS